MIAARRQLPPPLRRARATLKERGWSYRSAAAELGRTYQHLSEVLNGHRTSARLLAEITTLPKRNKP